MKKTKKAESTQENKIQDTAPTETVSDQQLESNFEYIVKHLTRGTYNNNYFRLLLNSVFNGKIYREYADFLRRSTVYGFIKNFLYDSCYQYETVHTGRREKPDRIRIFSLSFMKELNIDITMNYVKVFFNIFETINRMSDTEKYVYPSRGHLNASNLLVLNQDEDIALYNTVYQLLRDFPIVSSVKTLSVGNLKNNYLFINELAKNIPLGPWLSFDAVPTKDNEAHLSKVLEKYQDLFRWKNYKGFFVDPWKYVYGTLKNSKADSFDFNKFSYFEKAINSYYKLCVNSGNIHCVKPIIDFFNSDEFSDENLLKVYELIEKGFATKKVSEKQAVEVNWRSMLDVIILIAGDYQEIRNNAPIDRTPNEKTFTDYYLKSNIEKVIDRVSIFRRDVLKVVG
jgi:hypothetical protein